MMSKRIIVYASQIAACIGKNRYKNPHEALETTWKRIDPEGYRKACARVNFVDSDERLASLMRQNPGVKHVVDEAAAAKPGTSTDTVTALNAMAVPEALGEVDAKLVKDALREKMYTGYGTRTEESVFETLQRELVFDIRKEQSFLMKSLGVYRGIEWCIGGRIDAVSTDGKTVVEIKNRVNRLFEKAPEYENVQVQSYMQLVPTAESGLLVECLRRGQDKAVIGLIPVDKDDAMWNEVIFPRLKTFCEYLIDLLLDAEAQDVHMHQSDRSTRLRSLFSF